jgi:hypothetical protein
MYAPQVMALAGATAVAADAGPVGEIEGPVGTVALAAIRGLEVCLGVWLLLFVTVVVASWVSRRRAASVAVTQPATVDETGPARQPSLELVEDLELQFLLELEAAAERRRLLAA